MAKLKIVHFGTGLVGGAGLKSIIRHPDLELVGLYVHSPEKVGLDAGLLVGEPDTGIKATNSWDELLALKPDCYSQFCSYAGREQDTVLEVTRFLEAGVNVVSGALLPLTYPEAAPPELRDPILAACKAGNATFVATGLDPGFATSELPLSLLSIAGEVESVHVQELCNYGDYPVPDVIRNVFGFGQPLDYQRPMFQGVFETWWTGTVRTIGDGLGIEFDEIRPVYEVGEADRDIDTAVGVVEKGTTASLRLRLQGIVDGKPVVTLEHVSWVDPDLLPAGWQRIVGNPGALPEHQYRIDIKGDPSLTCHLDGPTMLDGAGWTSNHVINSIPLVVASAPGMLAPGDLAKVITTRSRRSRPA